ncbi:hypothetical protein [Mesorhizobium sp.]|nr:hypothetical protein [Mesorhizobium sp.]
MNVELRNAMNKIALLREHQVRKVLVAAAISQPLADGVIRFE